MRDDGERHPAIVRETLEEAFHGGNAAGGGTDTDDGEVSRSGRHGILWIKAYWRANSLFDPILSYPLYLTRRTTLAASIAAVAIIAPRG